ncbi:MAG: hypothetical protein ABSH53_18565 [Holophaga sp.]|jgi:hypothetical protein
METIHIEMLIQGSSYGVGAGSTSQNSSVEGYFPGPQDDVRNDTSKIKKSLKAGGGREPGIQVHIEFFQILSGHGWILTPS